MRWYVEDMHLHKQTNHVVTSALKDSAERFVQRGIRTEAIFMGQ